MWFEGYWWFVPTGGDTAAQTFCLYQVNSASTQTIISAATVTSGTLTANSWNYIALSTPVPLSIGAIGSACGGLFIATTAWETVNGFPDTPSQFGSGDPYPTGLTDGPLVTYGVTNSGAYFSGQAGSTFGEGGTNPATIPPPTSTDPGADNFWLDVSVSDTAPSGYSGTYRLYPNRGDMNGVASADSAVNYVVATEIHLSEACTVNNIWYYSPSGTSQLATRASVYSITGADSGSEVVSITSPTWLAPGGGAFTAGNGWCYTSAGGASLSAGSYKVAVYNSAGSPDGWSGKDASSSYWATGEGTGGITNGPLYAPQLSSASTAYKYVSTSPGSTPPYTGTGTEAGQCTFAMTGPQYPYLYVDGLAQNYWLDLEVTPAASGTTYYVTLATGFYSYTSAF
jgi:hypothetical protein